MPPKLQSCVLNLSQQGKRKTTIMVALALFGAGSEGKQQNYCLDSINIHEANFSFVLSNISLFHWKLGEHAVGGFVSNMTNQNKNEGFPCSANLSFQFNLN